MKPSIHELFDGSDAHLLPSPKKTLIGREVRVNSSMAVSSRLIGREGVIVAGPKMWFGLPRYQVTFNLVGRETVQKTMWLPAAPLLVRKQRAAQAGKED